MYVLFCCGRSLVLRPGGWGEKQGRVSADSQGPQGWAFVLRGSRLQPWEGRGHHVVSRGVRAQMDGRPLHPWALLWLGCWG